MINKKQQTKNTRSRVFNAILLLAIVLAPVVYVGSASALSTGTTVFAQATNPPGTPAGNGAPPITPPLMPDQCPKAQCIIKDYVNPAVKALTATAGVVAVISLIVAGIQYSSAGGDPSKVNAAKTRIGKTIGAFLFFIFLYVFLNYIVPGGV